MLRDGIDARLIVKATVERAAAACVGRNPIQETEGKYNNTRPSFFYARGLR
jgi:hypothetical protein